MTYEMFMTQMGNLGRSEVSEPTPIYVAHLPG